MKILSVHKSHDASTALIDDGQVTYYSQEERHNRLKHYGVAVPFHSLKTALEFTNTKISEVDILALPDLHGIENLIPLFGIKKSQKVDFGDPALTDMVRNTAIKSIDIIRKINIFDKIDIPVYQPKYQLKQKAKVFQINHHLCHAASAYYTSGFEKCLIATADGSGDGLSVTISVGEKGAIKPLYKVGRDGSLGFFYNVITEALGWQVSEGEGKTMGLAPYGSTKKTQGVLDFILPQYKNGKLKKGINFGFPGGYLQDGSAHWHFSQAEKVQKLVKQYGKENIAAEAQRALEEQMLNLLNYWIKKTGATQLACAGGVFLNVKMNQRIWETGLLKDFYAYPDAGDAGLTVGAGLYAYYSLSKKRYLSKRISSTSWGVEFTDKQIETILRVRNLEFKKYSDKNKLVTDTAKLLAKGSIVGWFQGRMEAGPRALGNRSILMDPRKAENKDIINSRVKYREGFRPFCPSMTPQAGKKYLVNPNGAEFMITSFDVPAEVAEDIPAVVHVDKTARPQIVTRTSNPLYYQLIDQFGKITGTSVLLNTSFNIKGEPVVMTPQDAIKCFFDTGLDVLVLGSFMLSKKNFG